MKTLRNSFFVLVFFALSACSSPKKLNDTNKKENVAKVQQPDNKVANQNSPKAKTEEPTQNEIVANKTHTKWSYSGLTGPDMWGDLDAEYKTCKEGQSQSPIDLLWSRPQKNGNISFHYVDSNYQIIDNGHTLKAIFDPGNKVKIRGDEYDLVEFHFHAHSEHAISGKFFPLEAHFVHKNAQGELAVIGILFKEGKNNPFLEGMWQQFPKEKNRQVASTSSFNPLNLIPQIKTHYHYKGSLTTPPCSEGVNWNIFNTPVEMSSAQIDQFKLLYTNNFRPLQKKNGRAVVNY